jgi:hypothetical protein
MRRTAPAVHGAAELGFERGRAQSQFVRERRREHVNPEPNHHPRLSARHPRFRQNAGDLSARLWSASEIHIVRPLEDGHNACDRFDRLRQSDASSDRQHPRHSRLRAEQSAGVDTGASRRAPGTSQPSPPRRLQVREDDATFRCASFRQGGGIGVRRAGFCMPADAGGKQASIAKALQRFGKLSGQMTQGNSA